MLIVKVLDFWNNHVLTDIAPPLTDKDVLEIGEENTALNLLCNIIISGKDTLPKKDLDNLKATAIELGGHSKIRCGRVLISVVNRAGKFSYHKLTIASVGEADHAPKEF
jgi:hypothetical protein